MPIIGVSAQTIEEIEFVDDGSYGNNNNEMVDSYSYEEEPNIYNTDDSYNYDPSIGEQNSEYSSYNSYGPPNPNYYGDGNAEYTSYDDSYEYPSNTGYMDDSYYPTDDPGLYENHYNNYYEEEGSYDSNYYPPKKPEKFTCPDSGLVVDKPENCPVICPTGSTLEGHFVAAGSNLTQICNVDKQVLETCGPDTDLRGVFVTDATPEQCNIFDTCTANDPLGRALGLNATQTVEVADGQLCDLEVPAGLDLDRCQPGSNLPAGTVVTDEVLCSAAVPAVQCGTGTTLQGVWVHRDQQAICDIQIPQPIPTETCPAGGNLPEGTVVTDERLCFAATPAVQCGLGTTLQGVWVHTDQQGICNIQIPTTTTCPAGGNLPEGTVVTDERLCFAATPAVQCGLGTTLQGVWVHTDQQGICNIRIPTTTTCPAGGNLPEGTVVTDERLCFAATPAVQCGLGTTLQGVWVHTDQQGICNIRIPTTVPCPAGGNLPAGTLVTDVRLCFAATPAVQCPSTTDLRGIWVNPSETASCNISPADITIEENPQAQCLKCADLAIHFSGNNAEQPIADALIGSTTTNLFTVCQATNPRPGFNLLIPGGCPGAGGACTPAIDTDVEAAFDECLDNAAVMPGTEPRAGDPVVALQENSLTTNVKPEAEISTFSEKMSPPSFFPPTIAQGTDKSSSDALEKMTKLKQQWLDLLP
jgi:hypothetical protein